jgi:hypothetical protein
VATIRVTPANLADRLARHRHAFSGKTAVLCPMERFDRAHFFALLADSKGLDVEAFTSYEEAIAWLSGDQDRFTGCQPG